MTALASPRSGDAARGEALWFMNSHVTVTLRQDANAEGITVLDHRVPCGDAPPLHVHHMEDEIFCLIEGEVLFEVNGINRLARAGETVCAPRNLPHRYRVVSRGGARYITITRGGFERMVRAVSRPAGNAGVPPAAEVTPALQAMLAETCAAHGISIIGPPLD